MKTILEKIEEEIARGKKELASEDGLSRLQQVLATYDGEDKLIWSDDLLKKIQGREKVVAHKTGLTSIDDVTGGFKEQQLITLSAHSKHGKTALALFLMDRLSPLNPVMIPMEQSNEELVQQRFDNGYTIPRFLSPEKIAARRTVEWIEQRVVEGIAKYNTKMVVIDHLGYIDDFGSDGRVGKENLAYRLQIVMQELKMIAKKWNVIVVLLVHIAQGDEGKPPQNSDLKGSSGILQESDKVIFLWRKNSLKKKVRIYQDKTMLSVTANRQTGKNGNIGLRFDTETGNYLEDNAWVDAMQKAAEAGLEEDELFGE